MLNYVNFTYNLINFVYYNIVYYSLKPQPSANIGQSNNLVRINFR